MINNIVCPECFHSWDQDGDFDYFCIGCGQDCCDQSRNSLNDTGEDYYRPHEDLEQDEKFSWVVPNRVEVDDKGLFSRKRYFAGNTEVFPEIVDFGARFGKAMLKKQFLKGGFVSETGPELIINRFGEHRLAPELKIETNQQWSAEELKNWLKSQPGNAKKERKPYFNSDLTKPYREPLMSATSSDDLTWFDEIKVKNYSPDSWPAAAPAYNSAEGWEFEKTMKLRNLKSMLTIEWLEKQQTEKHALVAKRLREIFAA